MHDDWIKYCFGSVREIHIALVYVEVYGQLKLKFEKYRKNIWMSFPGFPNMGQNYEHGSYMMHHRHRSDLSLI